MFAAASGFRVALPLRRGRADFGRLLRRGPSISNNTERRMCYVLNSPAPRRTMAMTGEKRKGSLKGGGGWRGMLGVVGGERLELGDGWSKEAFAAN